jgi:hypothetical protein
MPGTVTVREHIVREMMIDVMLGLWNDGFRKQLIINNHCKRLNEIGFNVNGAFTKYLVVPSRTVWSLEPLKARYS